jgi:O-antigen/teichoic acid export membrane protein
MIRAATHQAQKRMAEPLYRTAFSLMASTLLTAVLGIGFWAIAARSFPASVVGRDSALISSMATISGLCQLNMSNVIVRFLPQVRDRIGRRVLDAYGSAVTLSLVAAIAFVIVAPLASSRFSFLRNEPTLLTTYVLSIGAWTIFVLEDSVLTALGRAAWLPIENGLFSAAKIAILPASLALSKGHGIFLAWVAPMFVTVPVMNWLIAHRVVPQAAEAQRNAPGVLEVFGRRRLLAFLAQDSAGAAFGQIALTAIPLLVLALLGTEQTAYFYIPFTLVTTFDLMFLGVTTSLTTEGARSPQRMRGLARIVVRRFLAIQVPVALIIVVVAPLILSPFGQSYVDHGSGLLRLLAATSCCRSLLFLFGATARLQGQGFRLLALQIAPTTLLVGLILLLVPSDGLNGVGLAWLLAHGAAAVVVLPVLLRFLGRPDIPIPRTL